MSGRADSRYNEPVTESNPSVQTSRVGMTARLSELLGVQRAQALGERETFPARAMLPVTAYGLSMLWAWFLQATHRMI